MAGRGRSVGGARLTTTATGRVHAVINPSSGRGLAKRAWEYVRAVIAAAGRAATTEYTTAGPGDATRHARTLVLEAGDVVCAVGGDGTMNEVVNGLMLRPDAARGRFTICFIPAGSSNAMAWMTGLRTLDAAARALLDGVAQPLDLFAFHQGSAVRYGFLSCHMAMFADIDIDSEPCRWLGSARFPMYTAVKLLCCCCCAPCLPDHARTTYPLRVRWLPSCAPSDPPQRPPHAPTHHPPPAGGHEGWEQHEGPVQFLQLMSAPYMDPSMHCAPDARLDDGLVSLQLMRPTNRAALALCFGRIEQGRHLGGELWRGAKARSVVVDRVAPGCKVVVDGELVSRGRGFHLEPLPGFVNVIIGDPAPPRAHASD